MRLAALADEFPLIHQLLTTRLKISLAALATLFLCLAAGLYGQLIYESEDLFTKAGPIIGGDFIVFHHAGKVAGTSDMLAIYEMENLKAQLQAAYPGKGNFNFAWMYPPTMSLVVAPFAAPPYLVGHALWAALFGALFLVTVWNLWADKWAVYFVAASPAVFQALITGQNGFLTASLLAVAGAFADRRPILAGIAAGLLTIKPQLGLLIPLAFIAAGCWRAFAAAAATAIVLAAASVAAFGTAAWLSFLEAMTAHGGRMAAAGFPFNKLVTPFGFATMLGAPATIAGALQAAVLALLAAYVFLVWRRVRDWDLRLVALATAAILATPYAFYYEIVIMAPAMMLIAKRATLEGWLPYERASLIAVWILPLLMPGESGAPQMPTCAFGAALAFFVAARRVWPEVMRARGEKVAAGFSPAGAAP